MTLDGAISKTDATDMMVHLLGADVVKVWEQMEKTNGAHAHFSRLKDIFKEHLREAHMNGDIPEIQQKRDQSLRTYLLYLVGITPFTDKSSTDVDVVYFMYFIDLEFVYDYVQGATALTHLYMELKNISHYNTRRLT